MVKIFVGNLQVESCPESEAQLRHMFEQFGTVKECDILTGKSFGFVVSMTPFCSEIILFCLKLSILSEKEKNNKIEVQTLQLVDYFLKFM